MEIITWPISIKSILESNRKSFYFENFGLIRQNSIENVQKVLDCGTWNLWFTTYKCNDCWALKHINFTCKSRFCNSCSQPQSDLRMNKIISRQPTKLRYRHFVFTIPAELRNFFKRHRNALSIISFTASNAILFFLGKQKLTPWVMSVIHTFWSQLNWNPHVHMIVTNGAIHKSGTFKNNIFYPYNAIKRSRTVLLVKNLKDRCYKNLHGDMLRHEIKHINNFYNYHSKLTGKKTDRHCFFGPPTSFHTIVGYIWRYVKRPVIAQSRILDFDGKYVTFSFTDKRDKEIKTLKVTVLDFIWLLIQHIPNKHFKMVYYHGIFANRCKARYLRIINSFFWPPAKLPTIPTSFAQRLFYFTGKSTFLCNCGWYFWKYKLSIPWYPEQFYDP